MNERGEIASDVVIASLDAAPLGIALFDREMRFTFVNEEMTRINGLSAAEHVGHHPNDLLADQTQVPWVDIASSVIRTGRAVGPVRLAVDTFAAAFDVTYSPVFDADGIAGVAATVVDVTGVAALEQRQQTLVDAVSALAHSLTRDDVVAAVVDQVHETFADRVAFGLVADGRVVIAGSRGYDDETVARTSAPIALSERYPACDAIRTRASVVLHAAEFDRAYPDHAERRRSIGDEVVAAVPIVSGNVVHGVLVCGWSHADRGVAADVDLVVSIAEVTGGAIQRIAYAEAVASDRFRRALDGSVDGIAIARAVRDDAGEIIDFIVEYANDIGVDAYGRRPASLVGTSVLDAYPGMVESGLFETFRQVVETGVPFTALEQVYVDTSHPSLEETYHEMRVVRFDDGYLASTRDITADVATRRELEQARVAAASERRALELLNEIGLPTTLPSNPAYRIAASYQPAGADAPIGGDWYDVFELDDQRVALIVGDVAGHGRSAAVAMVELRALLKAHARSRSRPCDVIAEARLQASVLPDMATCVYAVIDHQELVATIASAGHPPPIITSGLDVRYADLRPGPPIGIGLGGPDHETTVDLLPGATLVFYTDGLIERRGENIEAGLDRLSANVDPALDPDRQCRHLIERLSPPVKEDDLCLVAIQLRPPGWSDR